MILKHSEITPKSVQQLFLVGVTETPRTETITTSTTAKSTTNAITTTTSSSTTTTTTTTEADVNAGKLVLIYYINIEQNY